MGTAVLTGSTLLQREREMARMTNCLCLDLIEMMRAGEAFTTDMLDDAAEMMNGFGDAAAQIQERYLS